MFGDSDSNWVNRVLRFSCRYTIMDLQWALDFLKGMIKPVLALVVVLMAVILSYTQKLSLEAEMLYSILRAFIQLSIIGFVLQFIFTQGNALWIILAYLFMVCSLFLSVWLLRKMRKWIMGCELVDPESDAFVLYFDRRILFIFFYIDNFIHAWVD